jgi:hypothetical protein
MTTNKKGFGHHSIELVEHMLTREDKTRWMEQLPLSSRIAILLRNGAGQHLLRALEVHWEKWMDLPEEGPVFKQDTPMMQVISCAQSIKMDAMNIRDGHTNDPRAALERIIARSTDLVKIADLSTGDTWKTTPPESTVTR